jgi:hypothetical protein
MRNIRRLVAPLLLPALAGSGYADRIDPAPARQGGPQGNQVNFPACPGFSVPATTIRLTPAAETYQLGDVTLLVPENAVSGAVEVAVEKTRVKPQAAGARFTPAGTEALAFAVPVTLRISYARCPGRGFEQRMAVFRVDQGDEERGGEDNKDRKYVDLSLEHMSEYVLATTRTRR